MVRDYLDSYIRYKAQRLGKEFYLEGLKAWQQQNEDMKRLGGYLEVYMEGYVEGCWRFFLSCN